MVKLEMSQAKEYMGEGIELFALGLGLVYLEMFLPGGVLGSLGAICILLSLWQKSQGLSWLNALGQCSSMIVVLLLVLRIGFWQVRQSADGWYLTKTLTEHQANSLQTNLLGVEGVSLTDLKPIGYARLQGRRVLVRSEGCFVSAGRKVEVTEQGEGCMIVRYVDE